MGRHVVPPEGADVDRGFQSTSASSSRRRASSTWPENPPIVECLIRCHPGLLRVADLYLLEDERAISFNTGHDGLDGVAHGKFQEALAKTAWGRHHQRRFTLVNGDDTLASARLYDLTGTLDGRALRICG